MKVKAISCVGERDVYNMEVEETHNFVIQGGVVAHNCADETRYFCMMRPVKPRASVPKDRWHENPMYTALNIKREDLSRAPRRGGRVEIVKE